MIALAMPETTHPYFAEMASHLAEAAERGYRVIIEQTLSDADGRRPCCRTARRGWWTA